MVWKKIFSLDSFYNKDYCAGKVELVIQYLRTHHSVDLEWVHLQSPNQKDGFNCGIFCAMNATFFLKSILEDSFTAEGPGDKYWSTKNFCDQDKVSIRENLKDVIYGDQDGSSLLRWIN
jgi:Ulp1 family protease